MEWDLQHALEEERLRQHDEEEDVNQCSRKAHRCEIVFDGKGEVSLPISAGRDISRGRLGSDQA